MLAGICAAARAAESLDVLTDDTWAQLVEQDPILNCTFFLAFCWGDGALCTRIDTELAKAAAKFKLLPKTPLQEESAAKYKFYRINCMDYVNKFGASSMGKLCYDQNKLAFNDTVARVSGAGIIPPYRYYYNFTGDYNAPEFLTRLWRFTTSEL